MEMSGTKIYIGNKSPLLEKAIKDWVKKYWPSRLVLNKVKVDTGLPRQVVGLGDICLGAEARATKASLQWREGETEPQFALGVEYGVIPVTNNWVMVFVAVLKEKGREEDLVSISQGVKIPNKFVKDAKEAGFRSNSVEDMARERHLFPLNGDFLEYLTGGRYSSKGMIEQVVGEVLYQAHFPLRDL